MNGRARRVAAAGLLALAVGGCTRPPSVVPGPELRADATQMLSKRTAHALAVLEPGRALLVTSAEDGALAVGEVHASSVGSGTSSTAQGEPPIVLPPIVLGDPQRLVPFVLVNELAEDRALTCFDFDVSSVHRAADGSLWIGDQRGPFLLHFDAGGALLEPPYPVPDYGHARALTGPDNPLDERNAALGLMRALERHARAHGGERALAVSNYHPLLADGDPITGLAWRAEPGSNDLFDPARLQAEGFAVIPWTVNDPARMRQLLELGVAGIITDRPDVLYAQLQAHDRDGDGKPGDLLAADGRVDRARFDLQGHRGARNLRPENTLPAMEAALDAHATTLELDVGITADGEVVVSHDPVVNPAHCRRRDGGRYRAQDAVLIRDVTRAVIQSDYVCDVTSPGREAQKNARELSPVAVAFAEHTGLGDPYVMPTLPQLYAFVGFYAAYYGEGAGAEHPAAGVRAADAVQVHFNVETKTNPARPDETVELDAFIRATAAVILGSGVAERTNVQSFDFRGNLIVQREFPSIAAAYLFGDSPEGMGYDGANLENSAWRAGLAWPYRQSLSPRVRADGGIGAIAGDGQLLYVALRRGLEGEEGLSLVFVFDLERGAFLPVRHALRTPEDAALSSLTLGSAGAFATATDGSGPVLYAVDLASADPVGTSRRLGEVSAGDVGGLWLGEDGALWRAVVDADAIVWRRYARD